MWSFRGHQLLKGQPISWGMKYYYFHLEKRDWSQFRLVVKIFCFHWWGEKMWVVPRKRTQNNQGTARFILPNLATNYLMYWKCDSYFFLNIRSQIQGPGILFSRLYNLQKFLNLRCELTMKNFSLSLKGAILRYYWK